MRSTNIECHTSGTKGYTNCIRQLVDANLHPTPRLIVKDNVLRDGLHLRRSQSPVSQSGAGEWYCERDICICHEQSSVKDTN